LDGAWGKRIKKREIEVPWQQIRRKTLLYQESCGQLLPSSRRTVGGQITLNGTGRGGREKSDLEKRWEGGVKRCREEIWGKHGVAGEVFFDGGGEDKHENRRSLLRAE